MSKATIYGKLKVGNLLLHKEVSEWMLEVSDLVRVLGAEDSRGKVAPDRRDLPSPQKAKVKLTKTATAGKVEAIKPAEKPDDAVVRSCKQWFLPSVRLLTAFACKLIALIHSQIGENT